MNLEGLRVLELAHWIAGPLAGQILGEWGAEVIKVERPKTGDITRANFPKYKGESLYYRTFNRDKKSITLDISSQEGKAVFFELVSQCDVLISNFTTSYLNKIGITYEELKKHNSNLIVCFISGFGRTGPYKDKKALDMVMQAMSGLMSMCGEENSRPLKVGTVIGDYIGAYQAVISVLIALEGRRRTGHGTMIDLGITDCIISSLEWRFTDYLLNGVSVKQTGNRRANSGPSDLYQTMDGYVYIAANGQNLYEKLCQGIGDERMKDDKFATNDLRVENHEELDGIIQGWAGKMTNNDLCAFLDQLGIPNAPVMSVEDLVRDPYLKERELLLNIEDPVLGEIPLMASPIKMEGGRKDHLPPPLLGQDNKEVYNGLLGMDEQRMQKLKESGLI